MAENEKLQVTALSSAVSNTGTIVSSLSAPTLDTVVTLVHPTVERAPSVTGVTTKRTTTKQVQVEVSAFFKQLVIWVLVVAIGCLLMEIWLAFMWLQPTAPQQNAIAAADFGWKAGIGVIIGLLAGKQI